MKTEKITDMSDAKQYCSFLIGDLLFGVEVCRVQEVIRAQPITPVPLAPREISGLINLRGQIVTSIDLRRRLDLDDRATGMLPMNVVVRTDDGVVSLVVDDIGDVVQLTANTFEPTPETFVGPTRELVCGVHKLENRLLLILDTNAAITVAARPGRVADAA